MVMLLRVQLEWAGALRPVDSTLPSEPPPSRRVNHRVPAAGRPRAGPSGYGCSGASGPITSRQTGGDPVTSRRFRRRGPGGAVRSVSDASTEHPTLHRGAAPMYAATDPTAHGPAPT